MFLRPSGGSFEALYCVRHTEKYTHLKNEEAQAPSGPPISPPMVMLCSGTQHQLKSIMLTILIAFC